jgi:mRNA interferase RelE/StbE
VSFPKRSRCRLTIYDVEFTPSALKEWRKLDSSIRAQFAKKLKEVARAPHIPSARLSGGRNRYRIKLRSAGYRLGYQVIDDRLVVIVVGVGRRDEIYETLASRWSGQ